MTALKRLRKWKHSQPCLSSREGGALKPFQKKGLGMLESLKLEGTSEGLYFNLRLKAGSSSIPIRLLKEGIFKNNQYNLLGYHKHLYNM